MIRPSAPATPARPKRLLGLIGAGVVVALGGGLLAAAPALAISKPVGSHVQFLIDNRDPANATVAANGWLGHGLFVLPGTTVEDFGCPTGDRVSSAFTKASRDGSAEQPLMTAATAPVRDVYTWTSASASNGTSPGSFVTGANDPSKAANSVIWRTQGTPMYTKAQYEDAFINGKPDTSKNLEVLWPSGTELSMVFFCEHPDPAGGQLIVSAGADGRAIASWFHFRTVANPANASETSYGFQLYDDKTETNLGLTGSASGTTGTLTATITGTTGSTLPDAAGSISFYAGEDSTAPLLETVPVSTGVASLALTGLTPGSTPTYSAVYTPNEVAGATFASATSSPFSLIVPASPVETTPPATTPPATTPPVTTPPATTPPVTTPPVTTPTLANARIAASIPAASFGKAVTAKVSVGVGSAGATGVVAMSIDKKVVRRVALASGTSAVVLPATLIAGKHTLTIAYAGNATTRPLTFSKVFAVAKATPTLTVKLSSSKAVVKKTALKATVTFLIPGSKTLPTGKVTIKVGSKVVKTINVTAANKGKVVITLPKFTKTSSKVVVTATYAGSPNIAAKASAPAAVKVVKK